ncbi:MAG: heavy metal translocating P-type ATPase metal-binding domain-containing protein [Deltaproteobacteria bacterium]|nr:heavy metal translocating P-type ATPase metal-binding domain-containing protein [Deltaproteobacteria bacterium]
MAFEIGQAQAVCGAAAGVEEDICFHCGLPLNGALYSEVLGGAKKSFCCNGCMSVAGYIYGAGL